MKIAFIMVLMLSGGTEPYIDSQAYETHQACLRAVPEAIMALVEELQLEPDEWDDIDIGCKKVYVDKLGWEG